MLALIPSPHVLRIEATSAVLVHWKLAPRTQSRTILTATRLGVQPCCAVQAAAHAQAGAATNAEVSIECPSELRATPFRSLLERSGRR